MNTQKMAMLKIYEDPKNIEEKKTSVAKAQGEKCVRCWKYRSVNSDGICQDCLDAIK